MSRYRRCSVRLFPSYPGRSSLSFITLLLFVFRAASALTALVHTSHIVSYAPGASLACVFLQREIHGVMRDYLAITLRPR
ncbi:hypothetical protein CEQ13_18895 [Klebsiella oxytoca]|nr:hypothetical protein CEQ13_18895 [Klebsiella oxytoca]TXU93367.1 hypothetical protein D4M90_19900 [Klebsiella oxytoca]